MASRYIGIPAANKVQAGRSQVVGSSSGGTLAGSQCVQVVFDDTVFTAQEGKQRLLAAVEAIQTAIAAARSWPIDSTS